MITLKKLAAVCCCTTLLSGCVAQNGFNLQDSTASRAANKQAEQNFNKPVEYVNKNIKGPYVVVLPGKIKSNNASFKQKVQPNNIADYAELELGLANFRVLERSDMGDLIDELTLAVNMGSRGALRKFKRGRFKSTNFFLKFDILKAEKAATAGTSFDGRALGSIAGNLLGRPQDSNIANTIGSSVQTADTAGVWIIGMRYKLLHATTTEQIATGYVEEKMEVGAKSISVLGVTQTQSGGITMDTAIQRLVQKLVVEIDKKGKNTRVKRRASGNPSVKRYQTILNKLGYNTGRPDGIPGKKTTVAVTNFQQDYQLPVTKQLDAQTKAKLDQISK